jgi:hypothetical protein
VLRGEAGVGVSALLVYARFAGRVFLDSLPAACPNWIRLDVGSPTQLRSLLAATDVHLHVCAFIGTDLFAVRSRAVHTDPLL